MKFNKNIEERLQLLDNSKCRKTETETFEEYIHDNQIEAAKEIVKSFTAHMHPKDEHEWRNNHVVLVAKMQSGKTGTCNAVVNILKHDGLDFYFGIKKYFYITGMNDNGLQKQTVERICGKNKGQIIGISEKEVCDGIKELKEKETANIFVQKNSDLRKNNLELSNCLIFIDESHYGSNKTNVLTKFLEDNGIDWKNNKKILDEKKIYIVSVSATPFDEIISDVSDVKTIVELKTSDKYIGVSEYLNSDCILSASKSDFKYNTQNETPIINYIKNCYNRIKDNKGVIFIRTRETKIRKHEFILEHFKLIDLDAKRGGSIDYEIVYKDIQAMIDANIGTETNKPIIFFIKGAYRAGITLDVRHKDYVLMVYDDSTKPEATAQGLLGRMCGYRNSDNAYQNTIFYINKQHGEDYAVWEEDFKNKTNVPSNKTSWHWLDVEEDDLSSEVMISTKSIGNLVVDLTKEEVMRFLEASSNNQIINRDFTKNEIRIIKSDLKFDYIGETYIAGRSAYSDSTIYKWFDVFSSESWIPYSCGRFPLDDGRKVFEKKDLNKIMIHVVLDAEVEKDIEGNIVNIYGNRKLLIYRGIVAKRVKRKDITNMIKEHKKT